MNIEQKVKQTIKKYQLCNKKEKVLIALSGGKDSAVTANLLKKFGYNLEGIHINLGLGEYSEKCLEAVKKLCGKLQIKFYAYSVEKETGKTMLEIFKDKDKKLSNCFFCGIIKKGLLNKKARELKADKIATGHNLNDELETFLMNILKGSPQLSTNSGSILKTKDKKFVIKIKPLFFVTNKEIENYCEKLNLPVYKKICPYRQETYRVEIRNFLKKLPDKEKNNLMKNFLELTKKMKRDEREMKYCEICGEPSGKDICRKCEFVEFKER